MMDQIYKHYHLTKTDEGIVVSDPRPGRSYPRYIARDFADARNWIDAYRKGAFWAEQAALTL